MLPGLERRGGQREAQPQLLPAGWRRTTWRNKPPVSRAQHSCGASGSDPFKLMKEGSGLGFLLTIFTDPPAKAHFKVKEKRKTALENIAFKKSKDAKTQETEFGGVDPKRIIRGLPTSL